LTGTADTALTGKAGLRTDDLALSTIPDLARRTRLRTSVRNGWSNVFGSWRWSAGTIILAF
jgi:hypothetical protein